MSGKAHASRGTARAAPPPIDMRLPLLITAAFLAAACERAPTPTTMGSPDKAIRSNVAAAPAAPVTSPAAAPPASSPATDTPAAAMPTPEALTDTAISGRVRNALVADPGMAGADVSVTTDRGVVVLAGTVKSHEQTGIASAHAQRQDGVLRVDNHLRPELS